MAGRLGSGIGGSCPLGASQESGPVPRLLGDSEAAALLTLPPSATASMPPAAAGKLLAPAASIIANRLDAALSPAYFAVGCDPSWWLSLLPPWGG
jgi:hypothetical protein